ncbi:unnamed protein product [Malus baccata var. baccata]
MQHYDFWISCLAVYWLIIINNTIYIKLILVIATCFCRFADPLTSGDYPQSMQRLVGNRLPKFTKEQSMMLIGSFDFLGLNYYTTYYAAYAPQPDSSNASYLIDIHAKPLYERNGVPIGPKAASDWLYVYPRGIQDLLHYIKENYHDPLIYITENGIDEFNDPKLSLEEALNDTIRVDYHYWHLYYLQKAIQDGVNVRGYFLWSLLDNFEWNSGYTVRFGINYVDYDNGLKRSPKLSAQWFKNFLTTNSRYSDAKRGSASVNRSSFPEGFIFGEAGSAYQAVEDQVYGIHSLTNIQEDVRLIKEIGFDAYRFSISWSRLLPSGKLSGGVNKEGIKYYKRLIKKLVASGLKPFVTLFHWDLPQALEDEYGGFLSPKLEACSYPPWRLITLNEPWSYSKGGRCSNWQNRNCTGGNSATEPYLVTHHQLPAHAAAAKLYKEKYQAPQNGFIGITFMDPLVYGNYPHSMQSLVGNRLPKFTKKQSNRLKGSFDFIGLNYYTANYAANAPGGHHNTSFLTDSHTHISSE